MKKRGGQVVVDVLRANGVARVFTVPGESFLPVLDALYDHRNTIETVTCRQEGGAGFMAEAEGKLTGRPGVCLVTRGPGACNAAIAVHTAFQDSTPMLLLVGDIKREQRGREAFQEIDFETMFSLIAKSAIRIDRGEDLAQILNEAIAVSLSNRPGPVVVALPEDLLAEVIDAGQPEPVPVSRKSADPGDIVRLNHVLHDARRPMVLVGGGGWTVEARGDLQTFIEKNNLPVCTSFRRNDLFDARHPNFVGELGIAAPSGLVDRVREADVLIVFGARLGEITSQGYTLLSLPQPVQNLVHIHASKGELGRVYDANVTINASPAAFAAAIAVLEPCASGRWIDWTAAARADYEATFIPDGVGDQEKLGRAMIELDRMLPAHAIITTDAGNFSGWPQRFLHFGGTVEGGIRRLLGPTCGAMGYGAPAAVAAKMIYPERPVLGFVGDGGMLMTGQELATAVQHGQAPVFVVFNNGTFGTIRMHQERKFPDRVLGTDLKNPDFTAMALAFGAYGERVEDVADLVPAIRRALESGKAAVVEVMIDAELSTTRATLSNIRGTQRVE